MQAPNIIPCTLHDSLSLSPSVRELQLQRSDGKPWSYAAGQWFNVHLQLNNERHTRSYSVATAPAESSAECIRMAITRVDDGIVSKTLHHLEPGTPLELDGPWGVFTQKSRQPERPAVYIATGSGLSPIRAMLHEELHQGSSTAPVLLLMGCRNADERLWHAELQSWTERFPRFRYEVTLSRPDTQWQGHRGYVQAHVQELCASIEGAQYFICGRSAMIRDVRRLLKEEMGIDRSAIRTERFD